MAGRRQPGAQRPAGAAGGPRPGAGGGTDGARRGVVELGRGQRHSMSETAQTSGSAPARGRPLARPGQRRAQRRRNVAPLLFISPWIIGLLIFTLWPVIYSAYLSFTDYDVINAPNWVGLDNYRQMAED